MDTITSEPAAVVAAPIEKSVTATTAAAVQPITNGIVIATIEPQPKETEVVVNGHNGHAEDTVPATEVPVAAARVATEEVSAAPAVYSHPEVTANEPAPTYSHPEVKAEQAVPVYSHPEVVQAEAGSAFVPVEAVSAAAVEVAPIEAVILAAPAPIATPVATPVETTLAAPIAAPITAPIATPVATSIAAPVEVPAAATPPVVAATPGTIKLPEHVEVAIQNIATAENFSQFTINLSTGANVGDGFAGEITKVTLIGNRVINGVTYADSELVLVVKLPPENKVREMHGMKLFEREVFAYNELLPTFAKFQQDHGLKSGSAGFYNYPKCYYAHHDKALGQSVIIMEDIRERGFKMENKNKPVQYSHVKTVMEKLAEFHAISLAMKQQRPQEFARFKELKDVMGNDDPKAKEMGKMMLAGAGERALATLDDNEQVLKDKIRRILDIIPNESDRYLGENSEPYSVINHGDSWINNMMFKFEVSLNFGCFFGIFSQLA